jgi:hypothetical protein
VRSFVLGGLLVACAGSETMPLTVPAPPVTSIETADAAPEAEPDAPLVSVMDPADVDAGVAPVPPPVVTPRVTGEVWLRGSTHVHARPSGDSTMPIPDVIRWYETRAYDFIVLTDHNRVSEIDPAISTKGKVVLRPAGKGLIVFAGTELTHNPDGCLPPGDETNHCRIHVNLLGVTARPEGKLEWAARKTDLRVEKYQAAIDQQKQLGGLVQLNHPSWFWGMTPEVLIELGRRGFSLVEIANVQFETWNAGDPTHLSIEAQWDIALTKGVRMWGVATDDAHDYPVGPRPTGKYPAGGGWVVVRARRDPQAILDALAGGRFYSSTGVTLDRVEVVDGYLVVEVARGDTGKHSIAFVENGMAVATVPGKYARRVLPELGYVRAVVTRDDGKRAWIQPVRR